MRNIIQICSCYYPPDNTIRIHGLCNDGTVWGTLRENNNLIWSRLPAIPQHGYIEGNEQLSIDDIYEASTDDEINLVDVAPKKFLWPYTSEKKSELKLELGKVYDDNKNSRWLCFEAHKDGSFYCLKLTSSSGSAHFYGEGKNITSGSLNLIKLSSDQRPYRVEK